MTQKPKETCQRTCRGPISKPLTRPIQSDHLLIADSDDTALGAGTLTVHSWRAGPDCGKFIYLLVIVRNTCKYKIKALGTVHK